MTRFEVDVSGITGQDADAPARDRVPVRSMAEADLPDIIAIDRKILGLDRSNYLTNRLAECVTGSGLHVSLVAEMDGLPVGFVMARVDYGEFGRPANHAQIDTIGVSPGFTRHQVGSALLDQLKVNLAALGVERIYTRVGWNNFPLLAFLERQGFRPSQRLCFRRRLV